MATVWPIRCSSITLEGEEHLITLTSMVPFANIRGQILENVSEFLHYAYISYFVTMNYDFIVYMKLRIYEGYGATT
jgi:hypothetical protein